MKEITAKLEVLPYGNQTGHAIDTVLSDVDSLLSKGYSVRAEVLK